MVVVAFVVERILYSVILGKPVRKIELSPISGVVSSDMQRNDTSPKPSQQQSDEQQIDYDFTPSEVAKRRRESMVFTEQSQAAQEDFPMAQPSEDGELHEDNNTDQMNTDTHTKQDPPRGGERSHSDSGRRGNARGFGPREIPHDTLGVSPGTRPRQQSGVTELTGESGRDIDSSRPRPDPHEQTESESQKASKPPSSERGDRQREAGGSRSSKQGKELSGLASRLDGGLASWKPPTDSSALSRPRMIIGGAFAKAEAGVAIMDVDVYVYVNLTAWARPPLPPPG